ncbi:MAG: hypothetical protein RLZZ347_436 [Candidatus Parcubacteria bacterium]|jgi:DNA-3-methyladenine glycosylase I
MSYCTAIKQMTGDRKYLHKTYHDGHYGFPIINDDELFGRLILEINQAGLSWETILKKQDTFREAYSDFCIEKVARYTLVDQKRLMGNSGIIRNRLKINAAIENAKVILLLQKEYGSFGKWLESKHPLSKQKWVELFKKTFRFTGGEIVNEFLMSIGYLPGAHTPTCPVHAKVVKQKPMWLKKRR